MPALEQFTRHTDTCVSHTFMQDRRGIKKELSNIIQKLSNIRINNINSKSKEFLMKISITNKPATLRDLSIKLSRSFLWRQKLKNSIQKEYVKPWQPIYQYTYQIQNIPNVMKSREWHRKAIKCFHTIWWEMKGNPKSSKDWRGHLVFDFLNTKVSMAFDIMGDQPKWSFMRLSYFPSNWTVLI